MEGMARLGSARTQGDPVDAVILTVIPAELDAARRVLQDRRWQALDRPSLAL